jgi:hypothetical protein
MGSQMSVEPVAQRRPFNSPLENGLRALFVLDAVTPDRCDLQRLLFYDYLLVHSADVPAGPPSLHAAVPHRSGEWMVRRQLIASGVELMFAKELLDKGYSSAGITFAASNLTRPFLDHLASPYAARLRDLAIWVSTTFRQYSDDALRQFMANHLGRWGAEFKRESVLRKVRL